MQIFNNLKSLQKQEYIFVLLAHTVHGLNVSCTNVLYKAQFGIMQSNNQICSVKMNDKQEKS